MTIITSAPSPATAFKVMAIKNNRVASLDLLRGIVMILMALDHVRAYFHRSAFLFDPTDLTQTTIPIFLTRWITHYCAPVFVLLAGISAYLNGAKSSRKELSFFLFTRGLWLVLAELFIVTLGWTFNPTYPIFNLQVIWAIGICMMVLSAMVYMKLRYILIIGILLITTHNLLDTVHVPGTGITSILWASLHEPGDFVVGRFTFLIHYPVLPWIGIMAIGYCFGALYVPSVDARRRRKTLLSFGLGAIALFVILRFLNIYGDASRWSTQKDFAFDYLSFLNVTKYPPSLLYILMTLGPALVFLALSENRLNGWTKRIALFGRVPMFFYLAHIFLVHLLAIIGVMISGHIWTDMILTNRVNRMPNLKGYGFYLFTVYIIWAEVIVLLYPLCRWFDRYKKAHRSTQRWLSYF